jgi:hypothetical protein
MYSRGNETAELHGVVENAIATVQSYQEIIGKLSAYYKRQFPGLSAAEVLRLTNLALANEYNLKTVLVQMGVTPSWAETTARAYFNNMTGPAPKPVGGSASPADGIVQKGNAIKTATKDVVRATQPGELPLFSLDANSSATLPGASHATAGQKTNVQKPADAAPDWLLPVAAIGGALLLMG